jgi:hypothetical protein
MEYNFLAPFAVANNKMAGIHTQAILLRMTSFPYGLKNPPTPRGETFKGIHGKKYRV